jgi:hypothetical protein
MSNKLTIILQIITLLHVHVHKTSVEHLNCKLYYQEVHLKYWCNLAKYWLQAVWGWHDSVETCSIVIICEIIVCICWSGYIITKDAWFSCWNERDDSLFTVCLHYVHSLFTVCSQSVYSMLTVCSKSVHILFTVCSQSVHSMLTVCSHSVHSMLTFCSQYFHSLFAVCSHSVRSMLTVCSQFVHSLFTLFTVCSHSAHSMLTVCSQYVHSLFTLWTFRNMISFYGELLAPRSTPMLEDHPLSAVRDCLFNISVTTLHTVGRSSILNLRTPHAMVTRSHSSCSVGHKHLTAFLRNITKVKVFFLSRHHYFRCRLCLQLTDAGSH